MTPELILNLARLRTCAAFMGEKDQTGWWPSSFLSPSGEAFLSPVFPKTAALARVNGASGAAQVVHDEHIGIGDVYHLFRLPENIEHDISQLLAKNTSVLELIASEEVAQAGMQELSAGEIVRGVGPLLLEDEAIGTTMVARMAAAYMQGFSSEEQVFPYYRSNT